MKKHNQSKTKLYYVWLSMRNRCYNEDVEKYIDYGNRGIQVCDEWRNDFKNFYDWSMLNGYKKGLSIDRIDNDGNYCPKNCRWVKSNIQSRNKRNNFWVTAFGETKLVVDWLKDKRCKISSVEGIRKRLQRGWKVEDAISLPNLNIKGSKKYK